MGGGAVATLAKMFVLRPRPNGLNLQGGAYDHAWLWVFDWELDQVATFDAGTRAFPSGSIATAIAFTVGLWLVFPRGRWLFAALCFGAFLQRLYSGSHFLSDLIGGAAFGLIWAYACFHPRLLGRVFDEMETDTSLAKATYKEPQKDAGMNAADTDLDLADASVDIADTDDSIAA
jgi:membrane-associated phospholipid phosphatase